MNKRKPILLVLVLCMAIGAFFGSKHPIVQAQNGVWGYEYVSDPDLHGVREKWDTKENFHKLKKGDCDEWAMHYAERFGVCVIHGKLDGKGHAYVRYEGRIYDTGKAPAYDDDPRYVDTFKVCDYNKYWKPEEAH